MIRNGFALGIKSNAADGSAAEPLGTRVPGPVCQLGTGAVFHVHYVPPDKKDEAGAVTWSRLKDHSLTAPQDIIVFSRPGYPPLTPGRVIESKKEITALIRDKAPYWHESKPTSHSSLSSLPPPSNEECG